MIIASYKVWRSEYTGDWVVAYYFNGCMDKDVRGTYGTGCKLFKTKDQAERSGKRYVRKWNEYNNGRGITNRAKNNTA